MCVQIMYYYQECVADLKYTVYLPTPTAYSVNIKFGTKFIIGLCDVLKILF
jgi:hypothetical protein